jgi:hypothetical protein
MRGTVQRFGFWVVRHKTGARPGQGTPAVVSRPQQHAARARRVSYYNGPARWITTLTE